MVEGHSTQGVNPREEAALFTSIMTPSPPDASIQYDVVHGAATVRVRTIEPNLGHVLPRLATQVKPSCAHVHSASIKTGDKN